jgi:hypothetical protein
MLKTLQEELLENITYKQIVRKSHKIFVGRRNEIER